MDKRLAGPVSTGRRRLRLPLWVAVLVVVAAPSDGAAQPLTERTPNLGGTWVTTPWNLHFQFSHRFSTAGDDVDITDIFGDAKIVNYPTFDFALGIFDGGMVGFRYSSQSIGAGSVNEWQPYLKVAPIRGLSGGPFSLALTGAWNGANDSFDGELAAELRTGRLFAVGALRGFTSIYDLPEEQDDAALAIAGGVGVKINPYISLSGDVADLVAGPEGDLAWSAAINFGIPYTPHTVSILATNVTSGTLAGSSTGAGTFVGDALGTVFWGFEFTVPFSGFARWGRIFSPEEIQDAPPAAPGDRRVVEIDISGVSYRTPDLRIPPGTTVRWVNKDPVGHTVTPDDAGGWGSALIGPGETFEHTFDAEGTYPYHCVPHPFMTGRVVVER